MPIYARIDDRVYWDANDVAFFGNWPQAQVGRDFAIDGSTVSAGALWVYHGGYSGMPGSSLF